MTINIAIKALIYKYRLYWLFLKLRNSNSEYKFGKNIAVVKNKIFINGISNSIKMSGNNYFHNIEIYINGNENKISIFENVKVNKRLVIHIEDNNCELTINRNTTIESVNFAITENNSKIVVGEDCMFAYDIEVKTGDSHSIVDLETGNRINFAKNVFLGNHVWIGAHAVLLKGTIIPDNSVVASNAIVTKTFEKQNVIIAGNPARVIKENVSWDRNRLTI